MRFLQIYQKLLNLRFDVEIKRLQSKLLKICTFVKITIIITIQLDSNSADITIKNLMVGIQNTYIHIVKVEYNLIIAIVA